MEANKEARVDGNGGDELGAEGEVEGPGSAAPRHPERDKEPGTAARECGREWKGENKEVRREEEEEDGSGGGKPGAKDEIESQGVGAEAVTRWQSLGPGAGEEGAGECQSLRKGFKGEEKDGSHSSWRSRPWTRG